MVAAIEPFHAIAISRMAHELAAEGRSIIHMEFGQPSTGAPAAAIARAHEVLDSDAMGYWESIPLKDRIARHYAEAYGVRVAREQIILTCGASPALVLALTSLFEPGDRLAFARPGYVAYRNTAKALYLDAQEIECGPAERFQLSAAAIAVLDPAPAGIIVASPANPTGTIIARDELAAIVDVCRRRGIRIVSDEIYHGLSYAEPAASVLEWDSEAVVINSFSKYFSMTGWRLGWMVVPPELVRSAECLAQNLYISAPTLSQRAAIAAFDCTEEADSHVARYKSSRDLLLNELPRAGFDNLAPADGAFYVYADVSGLTDDSEAFCKRILAETGVAITPGLDFDTSRGHRYLRISFAAAEAEVAEAARRLVAWHRRPNT